MAMELRLASEAAVLSCKPFVNVQAVTTQELSGHWRNFEEDSVISMAVLADTEQHGSAVVGEVAVNGAQDGEFKVATNFVKVPERALLHFILLRKDGYVAKAKDNFDVYAHFNGELSTAQMGSPVGLKYDELQIFCGLKDTISSRLRFIISGLQAPDTFDSLTLSFGVGTKEVHHDGQFISRWKDLLMLDHDLPFCNERFLSEQTGKGVKVNAILRAINTNGDILAETIFPFALGELTPNPTVRSVHCNNAEWPLWTSFINTDVLLGE